MSIDINILMRRSLLRAFWLNAIYNIAAPRRVSSRDEQMIIRGGGSELDEGRGSFYHGRERKIRAVQRRAKFTRAENNLAVSPA